MGSNTENAKLPPKLRIRSWKHLYDKYQEQFATSEESSLWVFRGQRDESWKLVTALERRLAEFPASPAQPGHLEEGLVREFQRRLGCADPGVEHPDADNVLGWLALMQHHGTPTRLLDWTYSFFVAVFFALEAATTDAAVYAIDGRWCNDRSRRLLPNYPANIGEIARDPYVTTSATFRSLFARDPEVPLVYRVNPYVLNTRLSIQQGLFLCPGSLSITFEENLRALTILDESVPLHKWVIPLNIHKEVMRELLYMNVGRNSLFPGLDGFAQSLTQFMDHDGRLVPPWRKKQNTKPFENWMNWQGWNG